MNCDCTDDILKSISDNCQNLIFGKVKWILIQKIKDSTNQFVDGTNPITDLASWTPLLTATDETKVIVLPVVQEVVFNTPDIISGVENADGATKFNGQSPQLVTFQIEKLALL